MRVPFIRHNVIMKISVNWLKEFVDIASDPRQLKSDLTMIGLNTESLVPGGRRLGA